MAYSYPSSFTTFYPYHPNTTTLTSSLPSYPWKSPPSYSPNIPFTTPSQNFSYNHGYTPHQQPQFTLPSTTILLSASPPYTSYIPSQNPHISYQQQPQNFNSQSETFYQDLETLKQYLIETHELSNKYREELKEQIQNLSYSFKKTQEKFKEKYMSKRYAEKQTEEQNKKSSGSHENFPANFQATTPVKSPASSPTQL